MHGCPVNELWALLGFGGPLQRSSCVALKRVYDPAARSSLLLVIRRRAQLLGSIGKAAGIFQRCRKVVGWCEEAYVEGDVRVLEV